MSWAVGEGAAGVVRKNGPGNNCQYSGHFKTKVVMGQKQLFWDDERSQILFLNLRVEGSSTLDSLALFSSWTGHTGCV